MQPIRCSDISLSLQKETGMKSSKGTENVNFFQILQEGVANGELGSSKEENLVFAAEEENEKMTVQPFYFLNIPNLCVEQSYLQQNTETKMPEDVAISKGVEMTEMAEKPEALKTSGMAEGMEIVKAPEQTEVPKEPDRAETSERPKAMEQSEITEKPKALEKSEVSEESKSEGTKKAKEQAQPEMHEPIRQEAPENSYHYSDYAFSRTEERISPEKGSVQTMYVSDRAEIPQKLMEKLLIKTGIEENEFEIQVNPENLGKITVKVQYEDGISTVSIICSERKTMELISQSANEIGNAMEQNLGKPTEVYVEKKDSDNFWQEQQQENDHTGRDAEQQRQREEREKMKQMKTNRFFEELRLGFI